jgi:hypothetical protein
MFQNWQCTAYRGYNIRRMPFSLRLGAYTQGTGNPWFEGETVAEVKGLIDSALAELPGPV